MKHLYQTVVDRDAAAAQRPPTAPGASTGSSLIAIAEAERKLGVLLPKSFKRFAKDVGATTWPVQIFGVDTIAKRVASIASTNDKPSHLVAFAKDSGGNHWYFDTRKLDAGEYPIVFWDLSNPPAAADTAAPQAAPSFDAWLEAHVASHAADDVRRAMLERLQRLEKEMAAHKPKGTVPAPKAKPMSRDDVAAVEARLRVTLPKDYVMFTTRLGSVQWPLEIVDANAIDALTKEMTAKFAGRARGVIAFGREPHGGFVGFDKRGKLITLGGYATEDLSFLDFLERRIRERSAVSAGGAGAAAAGATREQADIPYGIGDDDRINAVWRAVAKAGRYTTTPTPDGRVEVAIDEINGGKRRMFLDKTAWALIEAQLAKLPK